MPSICSSFFPFAEPVPVVPTKTPEGCFSFAVLAACVDTPPVCVKKMLKWPTGVSFPSGTSMLTPLKLSVRMAPFRAVTAAVHSARPTLPREAS